MNSPTNTNLPFFAYGLFKPGQLGFLRIKEFIREVQGNCYARGELRERDGLPILNDQGDGQIEGALIWFNVNVTSDAYSSITAIEPDKQYIWKETNINLSDSFVSANVLVGINPLKGSVPFEEDEWDGKEDALFTVAREVIRETIDQNQTFDWNLKPLFRLEMAYLLLWSAIERYASLRYHLGDKVMPKVLKLADELSFKKALKDVVGEIGDNNAPKVFRADKPQESYRLNPGKPKESLEFYYQVRSNMTHRGKAVVRDFELVKNSLEQLYQIFDRVLASAFDEAKELLEMMPE